VKPTGARLLQANFINSGQPAQLLEGTSKLFVYGTLLLDDVVNILIDRIPHSKTQQPRSFTANHGQPKPLLNGSVLPKSCSSPALDGPQGARGWRNFRPLTALTLNLLKSTLGGDDKQDGDAAYQSLSGRYSFFS
jgi:hypothetical protein